MGTGAEEPVIRRVPQTRGRQSYPTPNLQNKFRAETGGKSVAAKQPPVARCDNAKDAPWGLKLGCVCS